MADHTCNQNCHGSLNPKEQKAWAEKRLKERQPYGSIDEKAEALIDNNDDLEVFEGLTLWDAAEAAKRKYELPGSIQDLTNQLIDLHDEKCFIFPGETLDLTPLVDSASQDPQANETGNANDITTEGRC